MPARRKPRKKPETEYSYVEIRVDGYEASTEASINYHVYSPQLAWDLDDDDPLYKFGTRLTITGTAIYPEDRAGETFEFTIVGSDSPSHRLNLTLKDVQKRDQRGAPEYRTYRGKQVPVYQTPKGIALLDKVRGKRRWAAWLFVLPRFTTDVLTLLGQGRQLYISLHEQKHERSRWVRAWALETKVPEDE